MKNILKLGVISLGCPKNTADTESLLSKLANDVTFTDIRDAEIVLLNTCAFLKTARDEVYDRLNGLRRKKVVLLGCMAGLLKKVEFKTFPQLFAIVSGIHYPEIADIVKSVNQGKKVYAVTPEPIKYVEMKGKLPITPLSYSYIKIAEGCNNACSFCLIPRLKGVYRSRPMKSIIDEAKSLIKSGFKEINLVAQDCGYYGMDIYGKKMLSELLKKLSLIKGDFWIRVLYVYPERIDDKLLKVMSSSPKICHYLDIPLQHGDPTILKTMRRPYEIKKTFLKIQKIREIIPDITFRTSLIVGFPGETQNAFNNLLKFIKQIDFDHVGVFEYSREKGTDAFNLPNRISDASKKLRRQKAMLIQQKISYLKNKMLEQQTQKVIIERFDKKNRLYIGRSMRFTPEIDGNVFIKSKKGLKLNEFYDVFIEKAEPYDLYGIIA